MAHADRQQWIGFAIYAVGTSPSSMGDKTMIGSSRLLLLMLTAWIGFPRNTSAETLHHWRFENDPGFVQDSVGTADLTPSSRRARQIALPHNDRGAYFPTHFAEIGDNLSAAESIGQRSGFLANETVPVDEAFTIELFANVDDLSAVGERRRSVMAAQAVFPCCRDIEPTEFSWAFTIEKVSQPHIGAIANGCWPKRQHAQLVHQQHRCHERQTHNRTARFYRVAGPAGKLGIWLGRFSTFHHAKSGQACDVVEHIFIFGHSPVLA